LPPNPSPDQIAAARAKADSVRKQLADGADFGKLAWYWTTIPKARAASWAISRAVT
jgi:hypothetical protein